MPRSAVQPVYQLDVTLAYIQPPIWRRLHVPPSMRLSALHIGLQVAFGWEDRHLYMFRKDRTLFGRSDGMTELKDDRDFTVADLLRTLGDEMAYIYDMGDDWQHDILLHGMVLGEPGRRYPLCVAGSRSGPPEDCGGPMGYGEYLAALRHRKNPEHADRLEWLGDFDPEAFSLEAVNGVMARVFGRRPSAGKKATKKAAKRA